MKKYQIIEHTADIGIRVEGKDLKELFCNAAAAMFEIMAPDRKGNRKSVAQELIIENSAQDSEELLINWLNELLSLSAAKRLIFTDFTIEKIDRHHLKAKLRGINIEGSRIDTEIKAATYHELKIEKMDSGYSAQVILDV